MAYFYELYRQALSTSPSAKSLELENLNSVDIGGLIHMKNLQILRLRKIQWSLGFYPRLFQHLVNLEKLTLQTCNLRQADIDALSEFLVVTETLKKLSIENCGFLVENSSECVTQILESAKRNKSLEWLGLVNLNVNENHEDLIAELISTHPTLQFLDLAHTSIKDTKGKIWTAFGTNPRLRVIFTHDCDFLSEGMKDAYEELSKKRMI